MNSIKVFNPEHDMALANGDRHFIAPRNIREMARDLASLLEVIESDELLVWGWDHAIKVQLQRMGIAEEALPTDDALTALRKCSERQSAHHLLRAFHADHPDRPYTGESIIAHDIDEIASHTAWAHHTQRPTIEQRQGAETCKPPPIPLPKRGDFRGLRA